MIKAFILLAILIAGQAAVQDVHADKTPYPVEEIYSSEVTIDVVRDNFKVFLRHPDDIINLPTSVSYRVDCYSDGSGQVHTNKNYKALIGLLNSDGEYIIRGVILEWAEYICELELRKHHDIDANDEGKRTWYL